MVSPRKRDQNESMLGLTHFGPAAARFYFYRFAFIKKTQRIRNETE